MKKLYIAAAMMALSVSSGAFAASTTTLNGGTIHFTGSLIEAACAVDISSADQTVDLGQYSTKQFSAVGDTSANQNFSIVLNDCDTSVSTKASVAFSGVADETNTNLLAVTSGTNSTSASGVGIEILDRSSNVLTPDGTTFSTAQTLIDGTNSLPFIAHYKATSATTTAGAANADAIFIMKYE